MAEGAAAVVADQRPLVDPLAVGQRVRRREDRAELVAEDALAGEPGDERTDAAAQRLLRRRRAGPFEHHAAVEEQDPGQLHLQLALQVARHQLVGDRGAHVVGEDEDGPPVAVAAHQLLGQVGLPEEAVVVVGAASRRGRSRGSRRRARCARAPLAAATASHRSWRGSRAGAAAAGPRPAGGRCGSHSRGTRCSRRAAATRGPARSGASLRLRRSA